MQAPMKVCKIKTNERSKKQKSIFSLDLSDKDLVCSSITGDISIYDITGKVSKGFKKHACSALCVRFSPDGQGICVSYDDGVVVVYDKEGDTKYSHKSHSGDVSGIVYTDTYLVSVGYDGVVVFYQKDGSKVVKKVKSHEDKITGVAFSRKNRLMVTQGSDGLILYSGMSIIKKIPPSEGVILENFFSRMDWSVDGKLLACGLMFNNKANSVEIFDKDLNPMYSLVGHVAPVEVVAFNPNIFFQDKPYHIVALASQDLSISMWNTLKPFPFLLLKNAAEMPILDMKWDEKGTSLYFCSYDGLIKKLEFEEGELGDVSRRETPTEDGELFLTEENIKMHTVEQNVILEKKLQKIKMGPKAGKKEVGTEGIEGFINKLSERKDDSPKVDNPIKVDNNPIKVDDNIKMDSPKVDDIKVKSFMVDNIKMDNNKVDTPIAKDSVQSNDKPVRIRKRVAPVLLDDKEAFGTDHLFIFNYNKKSLPIQNTQAFVRTFGDYKVELNKERTSLSVQRDDTPFFSVHGEIKIVCCSRKYLCVFSDVLKIYDLQTGTLLFPFIGTCGICFMDILRDKVLFLETDGKLSVINLKTQKVENTTIPSSGDLVSVSFDKHYYILCTFKDAQYALDASTGLWYLKKAKWNTIKTTATDYANTMDETVNKLENDFLVYKSAKKYHKMASVVKRLVKKTSHLNNIQEVLENKLRRMLLDLNKVGQSKFVHKILRKLNKKFNLQYFISDVLKSLME